MIFVQFNSNLFYFISLHTICVVLKARRLGSWNFCRNNYHKKHENIYFPKIDLGGAEDGVSAEAGPNRDLVGRHRLHRLRRTRHHSPLEGIHYHPRQVKQISDQNIILKNFAI